jgi:hypothetical protein
MTAGDVATCRTAGGHRPPLQLETVSFGFFANETFVGLHQLLAFGFGPAQCAFALLADLETAFRFKPVDLDQRTFLEPGERRKDNSDHGFAAGQALDHFGDLVDIRLTSSERDRTQNLELAFL